MTDIFSMDQISFLLFLIPGFVTVWSFRYFTDSKKTGDFEYLILSFVVGFITATAGVGWSKVDPNFEKVLENQYAASMALSVIGLIIGLLCAQISKYRWFEKIVTVLKSKWI
jgi:uncharacterized protein YacL